jgi:glycosyltransferase involved in cell wall biosynthesis
MPWTTARPAERPSEAAAADSPSAIPLRVSVIIPVRNERTALGPCLEAVLAQTYPVDALEIIVVDAESCDGTREIAAEYARRDGRLRLLTNPACSIPAGLNVGIRAARGDVIARVDARTRLAPDYLQTAVSLLGTTGADNVGGPVRSVTRTAVGQALALAWSSRIGLGGASARYGDGEEQWTDTVYLGVVPRRVFDAIGLYDESITQDEDTEFNYRLRARGGRILVSPRLRTSYVNDPSLGRIALKNFQFGACKVAVWRKHPGMLQARHLVPPAFVAALALGPVLMAIHGAAAVLWLLLLGSYAAACLAVTARSYLQGGERGALLLPVVLPVMHVSWGTGFLVGALRVLGGSWRRGTR